jgi:heme oxygenase
MDLFDELRTGTRAAHDAIERHPAAVAMFRGTVDRAEYAAVLGRAYWVHAVFESEHGACEELARCWPAEAVRADAAARDLAALGGCVAADPPLEVGIWADRLRHRAETDPAVWAGVGYVLEGARMGSRVLVGPVARALRVPVAPGVGVDYHLDGLSDPGGRWKRVRDAIAAADRTPADRAAILRGAVDTFAVMAAVHGAGPSPSEEPVPVLALRG